MSRRLLNRLRGRGAVAPPEYEHRYDMSGREWMMHLYDELMERESRWMGVRALKNPLDAWIYQEILHDTRPDVVVELGSALGGGTLFLCHMLDLLDLDARVITVDLGHDTFEARHTRIQTVAGDTRDGGVIERVHELCGERRGLLVHDADHSADVVIEDLRNYSDLVAPGGYLIVEDGVRDYLAGVPGPVTAIETFVREFPEFEIDESRERFLFTYNPRGFLRRAGPAGA